MIPWFKFYLLFHLSLFHSTSVEKIALYPKNYNHSRIPPNEIREKFVYRPLNTIKGLDAINEDAIAYKIQNIFERRKKLYNIFLENQKENRQILRIFTIKSISNFFLISPLAMHIILNLKEEIGLVDSDSEVELSKKLNHSFTKTDRPSVLMNSWNDLKSVEVIGIVFNENIKENQCFHVDSYEMEYETKIQEIIGIIEEIFISSRAKKYAMREYANACKSNSDILSWLAFYIFMFYILWTYL